MSTLLSRPRAVRDWACPKRSKGQLQHLYLPSYLDRKRGEWDVKRAAWTFLGIIPVLLICSAMYELFTISMALDSSHCFGQSGSGFVNGEGVPNPCAVNMGIIAAVTIGLNWIPLFLESNRHQGRSVSVNGVSAAALFAAMRPLFAAIPRSHPRNGDRDEIGQPANLSLDGPFVRYCRCAPVVARCMYVNPTTS